MADEKDLFEAGETEELSPKEQKKLEKARKKREKKEKKKRDANAKNADDDEDEEKAGGKLVLFFVTILIIAIWLGIIAVLIKSDVGGFGSSVLYPILKDVPYLNAILPETEDEYVEQESESAYGSLNEAIERIEELEQELEVAQSQTSDDSDTIEELQAQIDELMVYKEEQAAFEEEKEKFYEEVVFSDVAPDISEYREYYESIDPENAEVLYKQVIEQVTYDEDVEDYVKTYSEMKAKDAAAIFDTMTDNLELVADILMNMGVSDRADILAEMDEETAALLTEMMNPEE